jgi:uncharacterized protein YcfJ
MQIKRVAVSVMAGLVLASQAALAHEHGHGHGFGYGRDADDFARYEDAYRGFDRDERYARVVDVDPLVERRRVVGYRVTYVFDGRQFTTLLDFDPGRRLRVDYTGRPFGP